MVRTLRRVGAVALVAAVSVATGGRAAYAGPSAFVDMPAAGVLRYEAAQGQTNDVFVRYIPGATVWFYFTDVVPISPRIPQCRPVGASVHCEFPAGSQQPTALRIRLWDRDDVLVFDARVPGTTLIEAGTGNDRLNLHDPHDTEAGGLITVLAGDGDDVISPHIGPEAIDGGAGTDTVSYRERGRATASLVAGEGTAGPATDHDTYTGVENLVGSSGGGNLLVGDAHRNQLWGGGSVSGDDVLMGLGGVDDLIGGPGVDHLFGGPGSDNLFGESGYDRIFGDADPDICFPGVDGAEVRTCEWVVPGDLIGPARP